MSDILNQKTWLKPPAKGDIIALRPECKLRQAGTHYVRLVHEHKYEYACEPLVGSQVIKFISKKDFSHVLERAKKL